MFRFLSSNVPLHCFRCDSTRPLSFGGCRRGTGLRESPGRQWSGGGVTKFTRCANFTFMHDFRLIAPVLVELSYHTLEY
jgi:hypothetical protein